ncbi:related to flavonol reductase/cinnamoyl-CoA reductase [Rhynchosporium graminicola]|uniref:Related to flavonol reductase/cinnamoyl-CoA reductase n=1 Tax=Rhynchosporium graminicola TaxID=2792576 RepID=A0A1E1LTG4_9HELO|nr:related to flavonol reductase/cinnamoyl-CoA reductase [Rhynchosporium commune]
MPNTLVTGANGFLAAHIIDQLISAGHKVTGSVRSVSKGERILATHSEYEGKLNFVVVSEYAKQGTWDEAFKEGEFDFVVHTAAPLLDDPGNTNFERDFLNPSVGGALELLKSASKYGKKIKAISVTGSVNSMTTGMDIADRSFNSSEWLPVSVDDAIKANHSYISYCVAKAESEKAIWKYVEEQKPTYTVSVLLPALIFGPPIQPVASLKKINYSTDVLYSLFNGTYETVPDTSFPSYIDVRDLAAAHILALTLPTVANKRFLVGGNKYSSQIAVDALKTLPELKDRLPKDGNEAEKPLRMDDVLRWNEKLGLKPRTALQTFGDAARRLLELEKSLK